MDILIRLIENIVQTVVNIIQPTVGDGNFSYLFHTILLLVVTATALRSTNARDRIGYIIGLMLGLLFINLYMEGGGPNIMLNVIGRTAENDFMIPLLVGLVFSFVLLLPFAQRTMPDKSPIIFGVATGGAVIFLFLTWAASQLPPGITAPSDAIEALLVYRRRYVGFFGVAFSVGVLAHILVSTSPPPKKS